MPKPNPHSRSTSDRVNPNVRAVPLAVYRELAAELQATQTLLDSLHEQNQQLSQDNQQLSQENQQLKSEIVKVVNCVQQMGKVAQSLELGEPTVNSNGVSVERAAELKFSSPQAVVTQPSNPNPFEVAKEEASEKKWFVALLLMIVIGAFGVGYFVARPLMSGR